MALTDTAAASDQVTAASGVATGTTTFSPGAGSMAAVQWVWLFSTNTLGVTFTVADNHGNTYSAPAAPNNDGAGATYVGNAYFTYSSAPGTTTVKVTASNTGAAAAQVTVRLVTGQAASPVGATLSTNNGGTSTGTLTGSITTTVTGSQVYWSVGLNANSASVSAASGNTLVQSWNNTGLGEGAATGKVTAQTGTPGAVTAGATCSPASSFGFGIHAWEVLPASGTAHPAAAALTGTGTLTAGAVVSVPAAASLNGTGTLTAGSTVAIPSAAALTGSGTLTAGAVVTAIGQGAAALSGTGTLTAGGSLRLASAAALTGTGTLTAGYTGLMLQSVALSGTGTLSVAATAALRFTAGLFGAGYLSIPQVAGGLVNGVGGVATPQALPGSSQVAVAPPGSSNWQWLGTLGQVTALTYSFVCPGGADKMTCTILVPASYRTQLFNPGWEVKITRGGHQVWSGKLDEPQPSASGWTLTAVGAGNRGQDFLAVYSGTWPTGQPDASVNGAITRGLPWGNPGIGSPSGIWLGQSVDSGAQTVTGLLNLVTSRGGLTWYVNSQPGGLYGADDLSVFPLPTVPNRLLVCTTPVARTLGGDVNTVVIRYQVSSDNTSTSTAATYSTVTAVNSQSVAAHGPLEVFLDISDASVMTSAAAQAVGLAALQLYQRASFAGPFHASYGQLLNTGGQAIDPGTDQSATMVRMLLYDYGLGGEVGPGPITWITGAYEWDDFKMVATLTPMQVLDQSLSSLLSAGHASIMPVAVASA